ncbi:choline/carnitine/betaine transport [Haladaptatus litoreus]|uniref:Choline/carnitine/betaine transport n=1 Tax=Haladaptatus litoreus TaxID=553468 RepID=A0A1N7E4I3_9EURY|nr:BCCT family transporter [Haladaptatus litoreus]SIR82885.1 choline/carnitine/betaine transport [Haladaptatus litoreus]
MSNADKSDAFSEFFEEIEPTIFAFGAGITLLFVAIFAYDPNTAAEIVYAIQDFMLAHFSWAFLVGMLGFVLFLGYLILGPWGKLKLGDEPPEYSYFAYFSMMYSAGLAAGIVFWGPAEALTHYGSVPPLYNAADQSAAAMPIAVQYSLFHWSLTQWSCFTVMGLGIGYFVYNYGAPLRVSAMLTPFLGADNVDGFWGTLIDILAVFATLGGVATSLGFIGSQFLTGLQYQWGIELGDAGTIAIITGMTVIFTTSLLFGVDRGIRRLSNFNMVLFFVLMIGTLIVGPTFFILEIGTQAIGGFIGDFFQMSLFTEVTQRSADKWTNSWTVFYWAWPLAWSPFAGLFIARISRGRSVREVAFTGIGATALATIPWFVILGGTGVWLQHTGAVNALGPISNPDLGSAVSGYILYGALPLGQLLLLGFLILVTTFFVTSADSSTLAVSMMTTGGKEHPSSVNRIFWALLQGAVASILMVIGGADALQAAAITTGGPFLVVCTVTVLGLIRTFQDEYGSVLLQEETQLFGSPTKDDEPTGHPVVGQDDD